MSAPARTPMLIALVFLFAVACGDNGGTSTSDTSNHGDTPGDAGQDTAIAPDTGGQDVAEDTAVADSGATDTGTDTTIGDTGSGDVADQGGGDTAQDVPADVPTDGTSGWDGCPDSTAYVGDTAWTYRMDATEAATYCGLADESFIDWQTGAVQWDGQYANKMRAMLAPGQYALPHEAGTYSFRLPICIEMDADGTLLELGDPGELTVQINDYFGTTYITYAYSQTYATSGGQPYELTLRLSGELTTSTGALLLTWDGAAFDQFGEGGNLSVSTMLCEGTCDGGGRARFFDSCHFATYDTRRHNVTFEGGNVQFDLRYGVSMASTEPGAFVAAEGTLDGTSFATTDYWQLVYTPYHHHFARNFMVLFDAPIGTACGLAGYDLDENMDPGAAATIATVDCDFADIASRKVTADDFERITAETP